jgi:hypothetical protein
MVALLSTSGVEEATACSKPWDAYRCCYCCYYTGIAMSAVMISRQAAAVELYPEDAFQNQLVAEAPVTWMGSHQSGREGGEAKDGVFAASLSDVCKRCLQLFLVGVSCVLLTREEYVSNMSSETA